MKYKSDSKSDVNRRDLEMLPFKIPSMKFDSSYDDHFSHGFQHLCIY